MSKTIDPKELNIPNINFSLDIANTLSNTKLYKQQRIERGFDDTETWSLCDTIAKFIIPRLERYEEIAKATIDREPELQDNINKFLDAMKLITRDNGIWDFNEQEEEQIKNGLQTFPEIFMKLWW